MPDDWKDGVRDIVDEWGLELSDTIAKDTNEEFVKRISTMGVDMNLVQTDALDKLILNDVGFIAKTNKQIGESIISDVEKLLIEKGDWASAKESVLKHVEDVFSGEEKIVINNIGKTSKRVFVDTALGHAVIRDATVQRAWSGNIQAYSDMVAKSLSQKARQMGDIEAYRMTNGIVGWRRMSSLSGRTCNICASLHGRAYYFSGVGYNGMPDDDGMMFEPHPNGYCYQVPIYDEWTGIKNRSDDMLDADLDSWKIQNEHSMSNLVRVGQMPTDTVQTDFIEKLMFETEHTEYRELEGQEYVRFRANFEKYKKSLPPDEYEALLRYTDANYRGINGYLQVGNIDMMPEGGGSLDDVKRWIDSLDNMVAKQTFDEDKVIYRGIAQDIADEFVDNGTMQYNGFTSVTDSYSIAADFSSIQNKYSKLDSGRRDVMIIKGKKGQQAFDVGEGANEYILKRNTKFKILKVENVDQLEIMGGYAQQNIRLIYCEIDEAIEEIVEEIVEEILEEAAEEIVEEVAEEVIEDLYDAYDSYDESGELYDVMDFEDPYAD